MRLGLRIALSMGLISITAISLIFWQFFRLPHPSVANLNQIGYWLVLKDMSQQPHEIQIAMVDRVIEESQLLSQQQKTDSIRLTETQAKQLHRNIDQLKFIWFVDRVERYAKLSADNRRQFLIEQIQVVGLCAQLLTENQAIIAPGSAEVDYSALFFSEIEDWLGRLSGDQHTRAYQAVEDAIACWLSQQSLQEHPMSTRRQLVSRIVRELDLGAEIGDDTTSAPPAEQAMLRANAEYLIEAWMYELADKLAEIDDPQARIEFVDQTIARVFKWDLFKLLPSDSPQNSNPLTQLSEFTKRVDAWIERAPAEQKPKLEELYTLVKRRIFASLLRF
jgi:hypothetical protein